jgi:hypothetical protein
VIYIFGRGRFCGKQYYEFAYFDTSKGGEVWLREEFLSGQRGDFVKLTGGFKSIKIAKDCILNPDTHILPAGLWDDVAVCLPGAECPLCL